MSLQEEIDEKRKVIHTDSYPVSIGELISMYESEPSELDIHPEFQRFVRWDDNQKSKFIESILLGIPIPPIFVSQREDGVWDVIDGLQRLATIFGFVGSLKDEEGNFETPLKLIETPYLKSLEGKVWHDPANPSNSFTLSQRLYLKRGKFDVQIIKKESSPDIKYELFQRINTLGSKLSAQELRNCIFIMIDRELYNWIESLSNYPSFKNCLNLSEKDYLEKYDQEIVSRFFVIKNANLEEIRKAGDLEDYITNYLIKIWKLPDFNRVEAESIFKRTFDLLNDTLEDDSFKKWNLSKEKFEGRFLVSSFEAIAIGLANNINNWEINETNKNEIKAKLKQRVIDLWTDPHFSGNIGRGVKFNTRIPTVVPLGQVTFR